MYRYEHNSCRWSSLLWLCSCRHEPYTRQQDACVTVKVPCCRCRDVIHDLDHDAGGCSVCGRPDFALGEFCDRTMILCDQCEKEFHVGCLRREGRCDLTQLPTGALQRLAVHFSHALAASKLRAFDSVFAAAQSVATPTLHKLPRFECNIC